MTHPTATALRVLYLSNSGQIGGANRSLLTLWQGLPGHQVVPAVVCPNAGPMVEACAAAGLECTVLEYQQPSWRQPFATLRGERRWAGLLARVDPDLIHANDFHNARSIGLAAVRRRVPVVCHVHFPPDDAYLRWVFRGLPKPAAFIHNSRATADRVAPTLRHVCPRARHILIHNAVSLKRFTPASPPRVDVRPLRVGIVGNLIPIKGHLEFLEMAHRLTGHMPEVEYWIVGEDIHGTGHRALLEARTRDLRLENRVMFFGHRSDIPDLMRQLDILVCPSHEEPFGINIVEAMACGLPVVGSRVGGIPEVIEEGVTGYLVSPRDAAQLAAAVGALLGDPGQRRRMGQAGRIRAQQLFSLERHTAEVLNLYSSLRASGPI